MEFSERLRQRRQALGLTQEIVAQRLGVSAPAVNRWERGGGYPDILLLSPLARLLEIDLNTLLGFFKEPSKEDIQKLVEKAFTEGLEESFEESLKKVEELLKRYPSSHTLQVELAKNLEALMVFKQEENPAALNQIQACYGLASQSNDREIYYAAMEGLFRYNLKVEHYAEAEAILEELPDLSIDKAQMKKSLYRRQGRKDELEQLIQGGLYFDSRKLLLQFISLAEVAKEKGELDKIKLYQEKAQILFDAVDVEEFHRSMITIQFALLLEDKEETLEALEEFYLCLKRGVSVSNSLLFDKVHKKDGEDISTILLKTLSKGLTDPSYDFLREDPRFLALEERIQHYLKRH